jgi:hypothetical protein
VPRRFLSSVIERFAVLRAAFRFAAVPTESPTCASGTVGSVPARPTSHFWPRIRTTDSSIRDSGIWPLWTASTTAS